MKHVRDLLTSLWPLALAGLAIGCAEFQDGAALLAAPGPRYDGPITILEGGSLPPGLHEVALLQACGTGTHGAHDRLLRELTGYARDLGCDTIARVHWDEAGFSRGVTGLCLRH